MCALKHIRIIRAVVSSTECYTLLKISIWESSVGDRILTGILVRSTGKSPVNHEQKIKWVKMTPWSINCEVRTLSVSIVRCRF